MSLGYASVDCSAGKISTKLWPKVRNLKPNVKNLSNF
jgi:hypothetical protein